MTRPLEPGHLTRAAAEAADALAGVADRDWSRPAHGLEWSCRYTVEHVADCHVGYALLVTGRRTSSYLPAELKLDPDADPVGAVELLRGTGDLLAAVVATAPDDVIVWHPYGMADPAAVTGMGIVETLVHTWDVTAAFGVGFAAGRELSAATLARMFPDVEPGDDPWQSLLWATGRAELPGRPRRGRWRWTNDLGGRAVAATAG